MEVGNAQSLRFDRAGSPFELVFNDYAATRTALGGAATTWPEVTNVPARDGLMIQQILGADGAPLRNPTNPRPHKPGSLIHKFQEGELIFTVSGVVIASTPTSHTYLRDNILGAVHAVAQTDGRYFFKPAGRPLRFYTVRQYDASDISGQDNGGVSGPKSFSITLIAADPHAYDFTQDDTAFVSGATHTIPNLGTAETWPVIQIDGPLSAATVSVANASGFSLDFPSLTIAGGHYAEINMLNETIFLDGNSTNLLSKLDLSTSDFWSVQAGGEAVTFTGADGRVLSNSAWL